MKKLLLIPLMFMIVACTNTKAIEKVEVPVYADLKITIPEEPDLAIYQITNNSTNSEVLRAYGETVDQLLIYSRSLSKLLKTYSSGK